MGIFEHFPYTNFHEMNLDWMLNELKKLESTIEDFVSINALKYADPIQWNIVSQYEKNTIVIDPLTGTAYISVQPVPSGVAITNTDYWTIVFDLGSFVVRAAKNFTDKFEEETTLTATFPSSVNDWIIWGDVLYRVLSPIIAGDQYVIGSNIEHFTAEDVIGHIQDLATADKSNLVAAINEILQTLTNTVGDLDDLDTTDKSNLVAAINEIFNALDSLNAFVGVRTLNTLSQTLTGAINELVAVNNAQSIINLLDSINTRNGKFIFGDMRVNNYYTNGLTTDGDYFYMALSEYTPVNDAVVVKYSLAGVIMGSVNIGVGHYGNVIYDKVGDKLYVNRQSDIVKLDTDLNILGTIPFGGGYISVDNGVFYSYHNDVITKYSDELVTADETYTIDTTGLPATKQNVKIYDNLAFICCNYPNTLSVFNLDTLTEIARINLDGSIDGTELGEIQDVDIFDDGTQINIYLTAAKGMGAQRIYNPVFIITGNFNRYKEKEGNINRAPSVRYYVDSTSVSDYSLGTSVDPFKSLLECFAHCAYDPNAYEIECLNADATIDNPGSGTQVPPNRSYYITYRNGVAPNHNIRYRNVFLELHDYITATHEINIIDSIAEIATHDGGGDNLTVSCTGSSINILGDVYRLYPSSGVVNVSGKLGFVLGTGTSANVSCDELSHSHSSNNPIQVGNGLRYVKTLQFSMAANTTGQLKVTSKEMLCGILTITTEAGGDGIRAYMITSYGAGGSARTTINRISGHNADGWFTPAAITGECGVQVDISVTSAINFRATFTMLSASTSSNDDSVDVKMSFT